MGRFYGKVGYQIEVETTPGVWKPTIIERPYYGDTIRNIKRNESGSEVNSGVALNDEIRIVADDFALNNSGNIKYVEYQGILWKVTACQIAYPRITLDFGGVYNGQRPTPASDET